MTEVWAGIDCDWGAEPRPSPEALRTAERLVEACRAAGVPPEAGVTGYWPTVRLFWDGGRTEVEVFEKRYELYFVPDEDGQFSVAEYDAMEPDTLDRLVREIGKIPAAKGI